MAQALVWGSFYPEFVGYLRETDLLSDPPRAPPELGELAASNDTSLPRGSYESVSRVQIRSATTGC